MQIFSIKKKGKNKGFSLIEIILSMVLIVFIIGLTINVDNDTERELLDRVFNKLESFISFSIDESTLKNVMLRIHFSLSEKPQKFSLEFGPHDNFVIPLDNSKDLNGQFQKITDFEDHEIDLPLRLLGIGTALSAKLSIEEESSLYIYPTGEKDDALIMIASNQEIGVLEVGAFLFLVKRSYHPLEKDNSLNIKEQQDKQAQEIYEQWLKK